MGSDTPKSLVVVGDAIATRPALRVARCQGWQTHSVPHIDALDGHSADVMCVHWQAESSIDALRAARRNAQVVLLSETAVPDSIGSLLAQPWFNHLLGVHSPWFMADLGAVLSKLGGASPFGIQAWLPWGARIIEYAVASSAEKDSVFERIEAFMADIGMRGRLVRRIKALADEMLMNAIYDAPLDRTTGQPKYAQRRRAETVELAPEERPLFSFGSDGERFVMGIRDPFGALKPDTFKSYIHKGLRRGADQIDRKEGGAGLGLFLLFEGLNSLCLNLTPGQVTEVIGAVNIRGSVRESLTTPKAFNVHVHSEATT